MRSIKLPLLFLLAGFAASAQAVVVVPNLSSYASGTDVSTAFLGVRLTRLVQPAGGSTYAPTMTPALITPCTTYAACSTIGPVNAIGGNLHAGAWYRECYNANRAGHSSSWCGVAFEVMEARFTNPTDFVEFEFTWYSDPAFLIAYNAAGDEILTCGGWVAGACASSIVIGAPWGDRIGRVRAISATKNIARVVVGSIDASGWLIGLQYNFDKKPPTCPLGGS